MVRPGRRERRAPERQKARKLTNLAPLCLRLPASLKPAQEGLAQQELLPATEPQPDGSHVPSSPQPILDGSEEARDPARDAQQRKAMTSLLAASMRLTLTRARTMMMSF
jgi:hypothetical protein